MAEQSHCKKEKDFNDNKSDKLHNLELMDDFLEMEKLACQTTEANEDMKRADGVKLVKGDALALNHCVLEGDAKKQSGAEPELSPSSTSKHASKEEDIPLSKLKSRIISTFDTQPHESNMKQVIEDIGHIIRDSQEELPQHSFVREGNDFTEETRDQSHCQQDVHEINGVGISLTNNGSPTKFNNVSDQDLKNVISCIRDFLAMLCKDDVEVQSNRPTGIIGINKKIEEFSAYIDGVIFNNKSMHDFVLDLIHTLLELNNLEFRMATPKANKGASNGTDFIDKETLLENKLTQDEQMRVNLSRTSSSVNHSSSFPEVEGSLGACFRVKHMPPTFSLVDFENLKLEKENVEVDLSRCNEMLNRTKSTLTEVEQQLLELKSELAFFQKSNSLAETQLKCMAESYKTLESRKEELDAEVCHLRAKAEALDYELQAERISHQEDILKYNELQVQMERNRKCSTSSFPSDADNTKTQQEREIAAAAEKLAECQETIFFLGKQLNAIRNSAEQLDSSPNSRPQLLQDVLRDERNAGFLRPEGLFSPLHPDPAVPENPITSGTEQSGPESPLNGHNSHMIPSSPLSSKHQKQSACRSSSSPSPSSEKHGRGFRRIFSRGKIEC